MAPDLADRDDDVPGRVRTRAVQPIRGRRGDGGEHIGYVAWAGCLPEEGSVVVVLSNRAFENVLERAIPLVKAVRSD